MLVAGVAAHITAKGVARQFAAMGREEAIWLLAWRGRRDHIGGMKTYTSKWHDTRSAGDYSPISLSCPLTVLGSGRNVGKPCATRQELSQTMTFFT
jgi:hypothetical protein